MYSGYEINLMKQIRGVFIMTLLENFDIRADNSSSSHTENYKNEGLTVDKNGGISTTNKSCRVKPCEILLGFAL